MKNKKLDYKILFFTIITGFFEINSVTSLFEHKADSYEPYEYRRSEFENLTLDIKINVILTKISQIERRVDELGKDSFHQITKALHAARDLEKNLTTNQKKEIYLEKLKVSDSLKIKSQKRLRALKLLLETFSKSNRISVYQKHSLYRSYKHVERVLYNLKNRDQV
jgi:hypothetical protein